MSKIIQSKTNLIQQFQSKGLDEKTFSDAANQQFPILAPQTYLNKINWQNPNDPLKKMIMPDESELKIQGFELTDPIGDEPHLGVPNLVHRYPDRVLFLITNRCQINCRFCFRRELTHHAQPINLEKIYQYLSQHQEVREVIFSGGDPLTLSANYLEKVFDQLKQLNHLKIFRFHTRIPIVNPDWVTEKYLQLFTKIADEKKLVLVFHTNHPLEIDSQHQKLFAKIAKTGAMQLSQTVLLKSINDQSDILAKLFTKLIEMGVKPYYLHHPDLVKGTNHFRTSIDDGLNIFQKTKALVSGIALPTYVLDLPSGKGKVAVESLRKVGEKTYQAINFKNETILYLDPTE